MDAVPATSQHLVKTGWRTLVLRRPRSNRELAQLLLERFRRRRREGVHGRQETCGIEEVHGTYQNIRTASWIAVYWERDQERKGSIPALPSDLRFYCCRRQSPIPESSQSKPMCYPLIAY